MRIPSGVNFQDWADFIGEQESQELHPASYFDDRCLRLIQHGDVCQGESLPWNKVLTRFGFRPAELVIWCGYNGHKKSLLSSYVMLNLAKKNPVAIASLEMKPEQTLVRMASQAAGCFPSEDFFLEFSDWAKDKIVIYDQLDVVAPERILGMVVYCVKQLGCQHVIIDSLAKCGIARDDYNQVQEFVNRLQWAAKTLNVTIHLVAHLRKPPGSDVYRIPSRYDIRGIGELSDLCDTALICHKNIHKAEAQEAQEAGLTLTAKQEAYLQQPDQWLVVDKQRNYQWEGTIALWHQHHQFLGSPASVCQDIIGRAA